MYVCKQACNPIHIQMLTLSSWMPRKELRTIPNMITTARILASPLLTYCIVNDMKVHIPYPYPCG
ncbi:hypothetical protein EON63_10345 [archaeon]|nr:MAG: hypothetical protein EON63_10345 [archaeon]